MDPLIITAKLAGPVAMPIGTIALDALLAWAVATHDQLVPAYTADEVVPIEIPVQREPAGRFHLCSFSVSKTEMYEARFVQRRPVIAEAQMLGPSIKRIQINAGPSKAYRVPMETRHLRRDTLDWYCIGDRTGIEKLLGMVTHLGKRRGVGLGEVRKWTVKRTTPWPDGFPVVMNGRPLRPLPPDWPGLKIWRTAFRTLTYPYWLVEREQLCAVPPTK